MEYRPPASFGSLIGEIPFSRSGVLLVVAGNSRYPVFNKMTILGVRASAGSAPTGAAVIVDVNKNGTTLFTTQANRPTIAAGANVTAAEAVPDITSLVLGDYVTVDIDQIGSTAAGSDLLVFVRYTLS